MMRLLPALPLALLSVLWLSGCSGLVERLHTETPLLKPPASAGEALEIARDMARRGRWSEGMRYLAAAQHTFKDDPLLSEGRVQLHREWVEQERALEDQILAGDAENLRAKVALLEKLTLAEPDNLVAVSRRMYWKEVLAGKVEPLSACAERHVSDRPQLAKRCHDVAGDLPLDAATAQRLAQVDARLRAIESIAAERRRANAERERQARAKVLLNNAKAAIDVSDYRGALDILEQVARLQPNHPEVAGLQQQAWAMISPQVEALVKLGDHLYLDEQLEAAVATWQAALTLKPMDEDILARIERASTVLSKLEALRRQQRPAKAAEPAAEVLSPPVSPSAGTP